jgi:hypothetical protein
VTKLQRRLIILADEWLGVLLCSWAWHVHREVFWYVFGAWFTAVYVISYPLHWIRSRREAIEARGKL